MLTYWFVHVRKEFLIDAKVIIYRKCEGEIILTEKGGNYEKPYKEDACCVTPKLRVGARSGAELEDAELAEALLKRASLVFDRRYKMTGSEQYLSVCCGSIARPWESDRKRIARDSRLAREVLAKP